MAPPCPNPNQTAALPSPPSPGGIYGYPGDAKNPNGKLRLLYECAPMSMICEQVGAAARWRHVGGLCPLLC